MSLEFIVAVISIVLQFTTMAAAWTLGGAARWRRARWFSAVTLTAGCYSLVNAIGSWQGLRGGNFDWLMTTNLTVATVHAATWLVFSYIDEEGQWGSLPRWVRWGSIGSVIVVATIVLTGLAYVAQPVPTVFIASIGETLRRPAFNDVGQMAALIPLSLFAASAIGYVRRVRAGERGAGAILVGFGLFLVFTVEEIAVASGWINFIYLADLGYVSVIAPVAWQMLNGFRDDANALDRLSSQLADEVRRRTEERDDARRVMVEQQRLAALGRLAAGVGHEINNPLQYLRFNLEELRECSEQHGDAHTRAAVAQALEGTERIRQVVDDLRTYARPGERDQAVLDVREVVRAALRVGAHQWRHGIVLDVELGDVPPVEGNEGRLVQVVLNPLVNGAQAMLTANDTARATLHVATRTTPAGWAEIEVRDEGPGFAADVIGRLGEPYLTTRASEGGTGLGLFVSRGIVEAHDGTMSFGNDPNGGAVVRIRFPAARMSRRTPDATPMPVAAPHGDASARIAANAAVNAAVNVTARVAPPVAPARVLLVEDDEPALRALLRGLTAEGMTVHGETGARRALEWLDTNDVDIVVTDLMMPGMSGPAFADALATQHPMLRERLVVLTGGAATDDAEALLADPRLLVLEKPITRQELSRHLRERIAPTG